jgi:hypothetical protein
LVWFGSEELGIFGSSHFVTTHQELLDRTVGMLSVDCLTRPMEGLELDLTLETWSLGKFGQPTNPWSAYLADTAASHGVTVSTHEDYRFYSDNGPFTGFNVPNANLGYFNEVPMRIYGGVHNAGHLHDPYDTVDLVREVQDVLEEMAIVTLSALLDLSQAGPGFRQTPAVAGRALILASHTEPPHMTPATFPEFGMALAFEGLDVDLIPYRQSFTQGDLSGAELVLVLPAIDYPSHNDSLGLYDEAWREAELSALQAYVEGGGLLVLTNSAFRLGIGNVVYQENEDWREANRVAERFGIRFMNERAYADEATPWGEHPLMEGVFRLEMVAENGLLFELGEGEVLAYQDGEPIVALIEHGGNGGQVLVLADVGLLGMGYGRQGNVAFWRNLGAYASSRAP